MSTPISFDEAKSILSELHKFACEDWAFGDAESFWVNEDSEQIAGSYISWGKSGSGCTVWFTDDRVIDCTDNQMRELNECYRKITRSRNDSMDEDDAE